VSVFIEKIRARHTHLRGGSHVGAINAFGTIMHSHFVTVVGEVPAETVEKIGHNINFTGIQ
jgi:sigma-E factor negative regulatory protein RseB